MEDSMLFYRSFWNAVNKIDSAETKIEIYDAIFTYALDGEIPKNLSPLADISFTLIKPQVDANLKRRRDGRNGGRPQRETSGLENKNQWFSNSETESKDTFTDAKPNENVNENNNVNKNSNEKGECESTHTCKGYGIYKNVFLTEEEVFEILEKYPDIGSYGINRLSEYMEGNGVKYHNHFAKVMEWLKKDEDILRKQKKVDEEKEIAKRQREAYFDPINDIFS